MLPPTRVLKKCIKGIIWGIVQRVLVGHDAIGLNAMLQTVQFPASIPDLHTRLANVDGNDLTL